MVKFGVVFIGVSLRRTLLLFSNEFALFKRHELRLFSNSMPNSVLRFVSSNTLLVERILLIFCQGETPTLLKRVYSLKSQEN